MDAFTGEIRLLPYTFAPMDWALCNGASLPTNQYQVLYSIITTRYGGNTTAFNVPNMQGTVPIGMGSGPGLTPRTLAATAVGDSSVTINSAQIAVHTHTVTAKYVAGPAGTAVASLVASPAADSWLSRTIVTAGTANSPVSDFMPSGTPDTTFPAQTIAQGGGAPVPAAHENRQPFMPMNFCICLNGIYPVNPG